MKKKLSLIIPIIVLIILFMSLISWLFSGEDVSQSHEISSFKIKTLKDKPILYVHHTADKGNALNSLGKLTQYYLLFSDSKYDIIFPQLSVESRKIKGGYYAVGYEGTPPTVNGIHKTVLKGGEFASYRYKGSYLKIHKAINLIFKTVKKDEDYKIHSDREIRFIYWNNLNDTRPEDLITEVQIRVQPKDSDL